MGAAVSITRLDKTASELRKAASGEKDSAASRRILALALVLDGVDRKTAAETCGMEAASRIGRACRGRSRPCGARCRALAAGRSARRIAAALRCRVTRAFGREGPDQA